MTADIEQEMDVTLVSAPVRQGLQWIYYSSQAYARGSLQFSQAEATSSA